MIEEIQAVAERFLAEKGLSYSRILGGTWIQPRPAAMWYSLFEDGVERKSGLWKVDAERRRLSPDEADSGNAICVLVDPETHACAPFFSM